MQLLIDTRQQRNKHRFKDTYFSEHGISPVHCCLPYGDYMELPDALPFDMTLQIYDISDLFERRALIPPKTRKSIVEALNDIHPRSVDTKRSMDELYQNIVHDHERLRNECILGGDDLYFLVESKTVKSIDDVRGWTMRKPKPAPKSSKPPMSGEALAKAMRTMSDKYGVHFEFCAECDAGRRIIEILATKTKNTD